MSDECRGAAFSLLPLEGGAPKGRRLASQRDESRAGKRYSRIVIPSAAGGSFSFAVFLFLRGTACMKHRSSDSLGAGCFPLAALPHSFLTANEKDFSLSLEMTNAESGILVSLPSSWGLVRRHSPSFPWKGRRGSVHDTPHRYFTFPYQPISKGHPWKKESS